MRGKLRYTVVPSYRPGETGILAWRRCLLVLVAGNMAISITGAPKLATCKIYAMVLHWAGKDKQRKHCLQKTKRTVNELVAGELSWENIKVIEPVAGFLFSVLHVRLLQSSSRAPNTRLPDYMRFKNPVHSEYVSATHVGNLTDHPSTLICPTRLARSAP
jgi:hypothetical protein